LQFTFQSSRETVLSGLDEIGPIDQGRLAMSGSWLAKYLPRYVVVAAALLFVAPESATPVPAKTPDAGESRPRNVIFITTDGLRWQEVFGGADPRLISRHEGGVSDVPACRKRFDVGSRKERRRALLPFIWSVIARQGQIFGDVTAGSEVKVTNGKNFSYPGYNEMLTGWADPRVDSNNKIPNPNVTVLEWLNSQPQLRHRVAAFTSWDVFPFILNRERSGMQIVSCWEGLNGPDLSREERMLARLIGDTHHIWEECCYDSFTFHAALQYLKRERPRVLYISLGETDEFGHAGRYDFYLDAARRVDRYLETLWQTIQSMPEYRDSTTLIVSTDHGRGNAPLDWKNHGATTRGSERIWIAVIGPDTPSLGARSRVGTATQSQIAATLAAAIGFDFRKFAPQAAPPIMDVLPKWQSRQ
jgi:hypothetical protein